MIIFFDISILAVLAILALLLICSIFSSMISVYDWFIGHIGIILILFAVKTVLHCLVIYFNKEFEKIRMKQIILAIVTNIVQIASFWIFIHEMSVLQNEHPIITIVCTIFAIPGFGFPLFISLIGGIDEELNVTSAVLNIVCGILFIIACFIPSLAWKTVVCIISGLIGFLIGGVVSGAD